MLAIGAPGDSSNKGAVYLIDDGDDTWGSVAAADITTLDGSSAGLTGLAANDRFGAALASESGTGLPSDGILAIGAPGEASGKGAVYLIDDGGDSWGSVAAADVTTVDTSAAGLTLAAGDRLRRRG